MDDLSELMNVQKVELRTGECVLGRDRQIDVEVREVRFIDLPIHARTEIEFFDPCSRQADAVRAVVGKLL